METLFNPFQPISIHRNPIKLSKISLITWWALVKPCRNPAKPDETSANQVDGTKRRRSPNRWHRPAIDQWQSGTAPALIVPPRVILLFSHFFFLKFIFAVRALETMADSLSLCLLLFLCLFFFLLVLWWLQLLISRTIKETAGQSHDGTVVLLFVFFRFLSIFPLAVGKKRRQSGIDRSEMRSNGRRSILWPCSIDGTIKKQPSNKQKKLGSDREDLGQRVFVDIPPANNGRYPNRWRKITSLHHLWCHRFTTRKATRQRDSRSTDFGFYKITKKQPGRPLSNMRKWSTNQFDEFWFNITSFRRVLPKHFGF